MGWDAFGLPAENAAIDKKVHPQEWTEQNINHMKEQLNSLGFAYDWTKEINTSDESYYKFEQELFLKFYEKGLAYRKKSLSIWLWRPLFAYIPLSTLLFRQTGSTSPAQHGPQDTVHLGKLIDICYGQKERLFLISYHC